MSDLAQFLRLPAVRFERTLPGPIERVWAHLTQCELLPGWFGDDSRVEPREGGTVRLMGGHIGGVVTQWRPPTKLAYAWNVFAPGEAISAYPESYLTLDLAPVGDAVRLTLTHLPVLERFETQNAMGWHTFLDVLAATLAGGLVEARADYMTRNAEAYGVDLSNLQK